MESFQGAMSTATGCQDAENNGFSLDFLSTKSRCTPYTARESATLASHVGFGPSGKLE